MIKLNLIERLQCVIDCEHDLRYDVYFGITFQVQQNSFYKILDILATLNQIKSV